MRCERGQATIEFALALPLLVLLLIGLVDVARALNAHVLIANAAREGARYAIVSPDSSEREVAAEVAARAAPLASALLDVSATYTTDGGTTWHRFGESGIPPAVLASTEMGSVPVRVSARYPLSATTTVLGAMLSGSIASSSTMDAKR